MQVWYCLYYILRETRAMHVPKGMKKNIEVGRLCTEGVKLINILL